jgi:hypothetical protein
LDPLDYGYVVGHLAGDSELLLNEFVRKGDSVKDWETLVTRIYITPGPSVAQIATKVKEDLKRDCPHAMVTMRRLSGTEYVVEHSHNGCGPFEGHRSVRKFIQGRDGIYMIAYDMKNKAYNASEFGQWRNRVISAKLSD